MSAADPDEDEDEAEDDEDDDEETPPESWDKVSEVKSGKIISAVLDTEDFLDCFMY